jgi:hypothetical protein
VGEATRVLALGKTFVAMRRDPETHTLHSVRVPEHINVLADMACGAQASFLISSIAGLGSPDASYLYGSEGTLCFSQGKLYGGRRGLAALEEITIQPETEAEAAMVLQQYSIAASEKP